MDYSTISLQELTRIENLPESVEEICSKHKLFNLKDFVDYWIVHGSFNGLNDCGHNMEIVLSFVANKYALMPLLIKEKLYGEEAIPTLIRRMDTTAKIILCQLIAVVTSDYTPKISSLIANNCWAGKTEKDLFKFLYGDCGNFLNADLPASTSSKITQLKNRISAVLPMLAAKTNKGLSDARQHLMALLPPNSAKRIFAPQKGLAANNKIALFKLIDLLVNSGLVIDEKEKRFFSKEYLDLPGKNKHATAADEMASLDQEMRDSMLEYFRSQFLCLCFIRTEDLADYDFDLYKDIMVIDQGFVNRINKREGVYFSRSLYEIFFSSLLESTHSLLDGISMKRNNRRTTQKRYKWKVRYLVKKEILKMFNFTAFVDEMEKYVSTENVSPHTIDIESLLKVQLSEKEMRHIHRIKKICLLLLSHEFNLTENKQGMIIIPPTIKVHYKTILGKILDSLKLPATLPFLLARLKEIEPHAKLQLPEIRSAMMADTDRFFCVGETEAFGLVEWRRAGKKFSTQSIEALVIKLLRQFDSPLNLDKILSYIRQFRLITPGELSEVLRRPDAEIFIVFKNDMVGLKHKNYAGEIIYLSPAK